MCIRDRIRASGSIAITIDPDLVPGWKTLDIRWENVFPGYRDPHPEKSLKQEAIRAGRSGSVYRRDLESKVVYNVIAVFGHDSVPAWGFRRSNCIISHAAVGQRSAQRPQ